jgi:3',5'-cyclic AMP phosphodiesterase CpdA
MSEQQLGRHLFSYAVIADTHVNHGEKATNSVYPVNALHNGRLRYVVRDINARDDLQFVIHLGDLVHPVPAIPDKFAQAAALFKELVAELTIPLHVLPGNHDVGDKLSEWTPAVCIEDEFLRLYREEFGDDFYAFQHAGVNFIILNVPLLNSGLQSERDQRVWLEEYLQNHEGERFIFNIHYPVFLATRHEDPHYDNLDEPGRTWLIELLEKYNVEALFAGHVHNFWYQRYAKTDYYYLPSTACIRQDYSELVRTPPGPEMEGGRNDEPKHGYFLMHVHERGHMVQIMRTYGEVTEPGTQIQPPKPKVEPLHPLQNWRACVGFDMRQDWMELVQIPPSGGPDEFNRKRARNDYPLMALWEMGIRRLRIPKLDLQQAYRCDRLRALRDHGNEFTVYMFGVPDDKTIELLTRNAALLSAIELVFPWPALDKIIAAATSLRECTGVPIYLSKLRGKDEHEEGSSKFVHTLNHGFVANDEEQVKHLAQYDCVDGVVFRIASDESTWQQVTSVGRLCERANISGCAITRMSTPSPEGYGKDELWSANRIAESLAAAATQPKIHVINDTLADFDRGFFRRYGVVDRLYNPRLGFHVLRYLYAALNSERGALQAGQMISTENTRCVSMQRGAQTLILLMPQRDAVSVNLADELGVEHADTQWSCVDLRTGEISAALNQPLIAPVLLMS